MSASTLLRIGSLLLLLSVVAEMGFAAGTPAGTAISNQATVTYTAGSNNRTATSNTVTLYVAHKVVGVFSPASRSEGGVDNVTVYFPVQFTNTGNRADNFNISFNSSDPDFTVAMIDDGNANGVFDSGEPVITATAGMLADATKHMLVRVTIAANQPDNIPVTITATLKSTAADASPIVVANPGAEFQFVLTYTVRKPVITFTSSQSDVSSESSRIPGVNVTYTMSLDNTSASASGIVGAATVTFVVHPQFHYVSSTLGGTLSLADGNGNGGTVTWTIAAADLEAADPALSFNVIVQPEQVTNNGTGVTAGTPVYAMNAGLGFPARVQYSDGSNTYTLDNANTHTFNVGKASGAVLTQVTADATSEPGYAVEYTYTLKNTGNATDDFAFTQANGGGSLDVAHVFSSTSGTATPITGLTAVPQGSTVTFYVQVTIPIAAADGETIVRNLTATTQTASPVSPTGGSTSSTDGVITTVAAATVTIVVDGGASSIVGGTDLNGKVVPGTVMNWTVTVTNGGKATAKDVTASNLIAHQTTNVIVPASLNIDADGDGTYELSGLSIPYNGATIMANEAGGVLSVYFASIPGNNAVRRYQYRVAVQ